jgi:hypothetical protein
MTIEFDCVDCGRHVVSFGYDPPDRRCASCAWVRDYVAPEHQDDARERLGVPLKRAVESDGE